MIIYTRRLVFKIDQVLDLSFNKFFDRHGSRRVCCLITKAPEGAIAFY